MHERSYTYREGKCKRKYRKTNNRNDKKKQRDSIERQKVLRKTREKGISRTNKIWAFYAHGGTKSNYVFLRPDFLWTNKHCSGQSEKHISLYCIWKIWKIVFQSLNERIWTNHCFLLCTRNQKLFKQLGQVYEVSYAKYLI